MAPPTMLRMAWEAELRYFHIDVAHKSDSGEAVRPRTHPSAHALPAQLQLLRQLTWPLRACRRWTCSSRRRPRAAAAH